MRILMITLDGAAALVAPTRWEVLQMVRPRNVSIVVALAATLVLATGAQASQSQSVTISVVTTFDGAGDPFAASGGVVCETGSVSNAWEQFIGYQRGSGAQILLDKHFECSDGTFEILLRVSLDFASCDTVGTWSVLSGTARYATLRGSGSLTGDSECAGQILDLYVGAMHLN